MEAEVCLLYSTALCASAWAAAQAGAGTSLLHVGQHAMLQHGSTRAALGLRVTAGTGLSQPCQRSTQAGGKLAAEPRCTDLVQPGHEHQPCGCAGAAEGMSYRYVAGARSLEQPCCSQLSSGRCVKLCLRLLRCRARQRLLRPAHSAASVPHAPAPDERQALHTAPHGTAPSHRR